MHTHTDKTQEAKIQSVSNENSQKESGGHSTFQFVDNRPIAIAQRKLQEMANNSPQVKQSAQLQAMADNHSAQQQQPIQKKENNTGLPDNLKSGIENLSGHSMNDVKVHFNSDKPAQLNAHAYAQGTNIHLASGQEKHLPHEAWHVVQQKQGRVTPTLQMKDKVNINDDAGLEKEADVMGMKALQLVSKDVKVISNIRHDYPRSSSGEIEIAQRVTKIEHTHEKRAFKALEERIPEQHTVGVKMNAKLDPDDVVTGSAVPSTNYAWMEALNRKTKNLMIRGHLLNHDLGGFGVPENLYPISTGANKLHSVLVENPVKTTLKNAMDKKPVSGKKPRVDYDVVVMGTGLDVYFDCKWKMENHPSASDEDKEQRHVQIKSNPGKKAAGVIGGDNIKDYPNEIDLGQVENLVTKTDWGHKKRKGRVGGTKEEEHAEGDGVLWKSYMQQHKLQLIGGDIEKIKWGKADPTIQRLGKKMHKQLFDEMLLWHKAYYKDREIIEFARKRNIIRGMKQVLVDEYEVEYGSNIMYRLLGLKGKPIFDKLTVIIKRQIIQFNEEDERKEVPWK